MRIWVVQVRVKGIYISVEASVLFEWDERKNVTNYRKHRVRFETAVLVFDDPEVVMRQDREVHGEARWQTIGRVAGTTILLVAHTVWDDDQEETIRIISAREATRHERREYERGQEG